jgi:hypothetical protein
MRRALPASRLVLASLVALVALAAACASDDSSDADSGVRGLVTIGPMCPVVQEDTPCPDEPYEATIVVEDGSGDEVATAQSGADGRFELALAPGSYTLVPQSPDAGTPPFADEQQVDVREGAYTEVTISYDSGIR